MGEDLIENKIYVAKLFGSDLQGNDLYKLEPLKQIGNATFVKVTPEFKQGDILSSKHGILIFKGVDNPDWMKYYAFSGNSGLYYDDECMFDIEDFKIATEKEKQHLFDAMKKDSKRWNAEKLKIENIPQPRFKIGDKVRVKRGVSIGTNMCDGLILTVSEYHNQRQNLLYCKGFPYLFREDWLEPYVEELKKGDLAIFWDSDKPYAAIRFYGRKVSKGHYDISGTPWKNAIKFESKEQFGKVLRGEI